MCERPSIGHKSGPGTNRQCKSHVGIGHSLDEPWTGIGTFLQDPVSLKASKRNQRLSLARQHSFCPRDGMNAMKTRDKVRPFWPIKNSEIRNPFWLE